MRCTRLALEKNPIGRTLLFEQARKQLAREDARPLPGARAHPRACVKAALERRLRGRARRRGAGLRRARGVAAGGAAACRSSSRRPRSRRTPASTIRASSRAGRRRSACSAPASWARGIAYVTRRSAGIPVRLKDKDAAGVARGLAHVRRLLDERVKRKRITPLERERAARARHGDDRLRRAARLRDLVIEAVFEDLALKHQRRAGRRERDGAARRSSRRTRRRSRSRSIAAARDAPRDRRRDALLLPGPQDAAARGDRDAEDGAVGDGDVRRARQEAGQDRHRRERRRRLLHDAHPRAAT